jgi:hypothetical protein
MIELIPLRRGGPHGQELRPSSEIRVTVLRGGEPGETALLRSADGSLIRARIEGEAIRQGEGLRLMVRRMDNGAIRLQRVEQGRSSTSTPISPQLIRSFARFLSIRVDRETDSVYGGGGQAAKRPLDPLRSILTEELHPALDTLEAALLSGFEPECTFDIETRDVRPDDEAKDRPSPQPEGEQRGERNDPARHGSSSDLALARLQSEPHYFFCSFGFERIGRIGLLVYSADSEFKNLSILLSAEKKFVEGLISKRSDEWLALLKKIGLPVDSLAILPRNDERVSHLDITV